MTISWRNAAPWLPVLLALAIALTRGCDDGGLQPAVAVVDTVENATLRRHLAEQAEDLDVFRRENDGLRGTIEQLRDRIRGLEARAPDTIWVASAPVDVSRDTLARPTIAVRGGIATWAVLIPRADSLHEEQLLSGVDVRDCDDGFILGAQGAACNTARLGHLSLILGARLTSSADSVLRARPPPLGMVGDVGLAWRQCFRCNFGIEFSLSSRGELTARVQTGVRIF